MNLSALEAYDVIRHSAQLSERLAAAAAEVEKRRGLKSEKEWLASACELLRLARESSHGLVERARGLPGLEEARDEMGIVFQGHWVDALERLLAGISFHAGIRAPILEALFPHQKFPMLRKATREVALDYAKELERRTKTSYVTRMLAEPTFAFALPVLEELKTAFEQWQAVYSGENMPEEQAAEVRKDLLAAAKRLDLVGRQARLLAEAALAPFAGLYEELGLGARPKKRSAKPAPKAKLDEENVEDAPPAEPATATAGPEPEEPGPAEPRKQRRGKAEDAAS